MNKVEIVTIYPCAKGSYEIPLGNGTQHLFTNQKAAKAFLAQTNQFLTDKVFQLTALFSELHRKYRCEFFFLTHCSNHRALEGKLQIIDEVLKNTISKSPMKMGHHYAFINLYKSIRFSLEFIAELKELDKGKSNTINTYFFNTHIQSLSNLEAELNSYGRLSASSFSESPESELAAYKNRPTLMDKWFESQLKAS